MATGREALNGYEEASPLVGEEAGVLSTLSESVISNTMEDFVRAAS